jgi:tetratricopeptide (TPR) repeat protein
MPDVLSANELRTAEQLAARAQELDPASADLRDLHAALLLDLERPVDALLEIERAIDAGGRALFRLRVLAGARSKVGDFQGAMEAASEAAARAPSDVAGQLLLFESALRADDTAAALHAARTATQLAPDFAPALVAVAGVARAEGRDEDEIANLEHAVALAPADPAIGTALGDAYRRAGRTRDAHATWASVLAHSPQHRDAADAIVRSVGGLYQPRRMMLMFCLAAFAYGIALGVGVSYGTGWQDAILDALWVAGGAILAGLLVLRIYEGLAWPPGFRLMVHRAFYLSLVNKGKPTRRHATGRSALAVVLLVASLAVVWAIAPLIAVATEIFLLVLLPPIALSAATPRLLRRQTRRLSELRAVRVDPSICRCRSVPVMHGVDAKEYRIQHLEPAGGEVMEGMSVVRCPSTGTAWLSVRDDDGPSSESPVLIRLAQDPLRATEEPTGYL